MCVMSYLVVLQFLVAEGTHGCWTKVLLDLRCALQWYLIEEIPFHTLLCNCTRYSMKGRRSSSLSCGAWKTRSWLSMAGIRDTARQDNMIGLCLFLSSMADSKLAYTTTGAGISNRWLVNRRWVYCDFNLIMPRSSIGPPCTYISLFIDIRSITISLLMRLLLVNSCSYVRTMLNTRFIYLSQ